MKKILSVLFLMIFSVCLISCNAKNTSQTKSQDISSTTSGELFMKIDGVSVDAIWEDNSSVQDLFKHAKNGLTINMHQYGGFEQVGSIGKNIVSNNKQITTNPGDVVLYNSNQIVIFFGTNTWSYTKLGHINLNQTELNNLLNKSNVVLYLNIK